VVRRPCLTCSTARKGTFKDSLVECNTNAATRWGGTGTILVNHQPPRFWHEKNKPRSQTRHTRRPFTTNDAKACKIPYSLFCNASIIYAHLSYSKECVRDAGHQTLLRIDYSILAILFIYLKIRFLFLNRYRKGGSLRNQEVKRYSDTRSLTPSSGHVTGV
jgi:hypothetical protein